MTLPFTITRTLAPGDWQKLRVALARNGVDVDWSAFADTLAAGYSASTAPPDAKLETIAATLNAP